MAEKKEMRFYKGIPDIFKPHKSEDPFKKCTICDADLFSSYFPYIIEKAIKKYKGYPHHDVIFEYAICYSCTSKLQEGISDESKQTMAQYYSKFFEKDEVINETEEQTLLRKMSSCMIKGTPVRELEEYQVAGFFIGHHLMLNDSPMVISSVVAEELNEILSKKTKDEFDDFKRNITAPPPEFEELFRKKLVFI